MTRSRYFQGINEPDQFVWLCKLNASQNIQAETHAQQFLISPTIHQLSLVRSWAMHQHSRAQVANFVMRVLKSAQIGTFLPLIINQIDNVLSTTDMLGATLYARHSVESDLLGVTYWKDLAAFENYKEWASEHLWRDVVSTQTQAVPLRLLTHRVN